MLDIVIEVKLELKGTNTRHSIYYQNKSAEMGNVSGMYNVGYCYQNGIGVEKDEHKTFVYYQKATEIGNVNWSIQYWICYRNGIGVEESKHKAFHLLPKVNRDGKR